MGSMLRRCGRKTPIDLNPAIPDPFTGLSIEKGWSVDRSERPPRGTMDGRSVVHEKISKEAILLMVGAAAIVEYL